MWLRLLNFMSHMYKRYWKFKYTNSDIYAKMINTRKEKVNIS